jgi:hypothetical protein
VCLRLQAKRRKCEEEAFALLKQALAAVQEANMKLQVAEQVLNLLALHQYKSTNADVDFRAGDPEAAGLRGNGGGVVTLVYKP